MKTLMTLISIFPLAAFAAESDYGPHNQPYFSKIILANNYGIGNNVDLEKPKKTGQIIASFHFAH